MSLYQTELLDSAGKGNHNHDRGFVMMINAPWGAGKTYFLNYYEKHLSLIDNQLTCADKKYLKVKLIPYNAWENDDQDPFLSLLAAITKYLKIKLSENILEASKDLSAAIYNVFQVYCLTHGVPAPAIDNVLIKPIKNFCTHIKKFIKKMNKKQFDETIKSINELEVIKEKFRSSLSSIGGENVLKVFIIDELDRCRPDFSVKILETIKHFFNTPNVVFIIACDQFALAETVKKFYGYGYDGLGYLSRFFNIQLDLPESNEVYEYLLSNVLGDINGCYIFKKITPFFDANKKLRDFLKVLNAFKLLDLRTSKTSPYLKTYMIILLFLKIIHPDKFQKLINLNLKKHEGDVLFVTKKDTTENDFYKFISLFPNSITADITNENSLENGNPTQWIFALFLSLCRCNALRNINFQPETFGGIENNSYDKSKIGYFSKQVQKLGANMILTRLEIDTLIILVQTANIN